MDPVFIGGLLFTLLGIVIAMILDGNSLAPLIGPSAFLLVFMASVGAAVMAYRKHEVKLLPKSAMKALKPDVPDVQATITQLAKLAEVARREGMLALEQRIEETDDRFLQIGIQLLADGVDEQVVRETLEIEMAAMDERHRTAISFFESLTAMAPTFGMLGTVIALVNMLGNLSDPDQLGVGMSLALLTTFYGVMIGNLVFSPIATRLERLNDAELAAMEVAIDGIMTIRRGASPRNVIERLESYLPPGERIGPGDRLAEVRDEAA